MEPPHNSAEATGSQPLQTKLDQDNESINKGIELDSFMVHRRSATPRVTHIERITSQDTNSTSKSSKIVIGSEIADDDVDDIDKPIQEVQEREYLHGRKLILAFLAWLATEFMGGLGGNMLSPALPIVASQFNGLNQLGWVSGAYYMTQVGCMLLFGQCLAIFNAKHVLLAAIGFFMLGSCISGAANNIEILIFGRAVAGIGSAGCWVWVQTLVSMLVVLEHRPKLLGLFGVQNAVSGTVGAILAGALSAKSHWRWCLLLVLPLGALTMGFAIFALPSLPPWPLNEDTTAKLDKQLYLVYRFFIVTSSIICLVLALQWGGSTFAWNSPVIIGLFIGFGAIMALFMFWEHKAAWPILPPPALKNHTNVGASLLAGFTLMCNLFLAVYLPVLYEAGRGVSSLHAGILIVAFLLTVVVSQAVEGFIMSYTKRYWHWGFASPAFLALGGGLLYKVDINTSSSMLIGLQIIYGLGVGLTQNVAFLSVQADNPAKAVPAAIAMVSFVQLFGGMCGPEIGNAVLSGSLKKYLPQFGVPADTATAVERSSVSAIWELEDGLRTLVIKAYLKSLNNVFVSVVPVAFLIFLSALLIRNKRLD